MQSRALRPDAQAFDEIRIRTVPRYKTSELSGDEWRISAVTEFYRNGKKLHETVCSDVQHACYLLGSEHIKASEGLAYYAGEGDFCDQEGCAEKASYKYFLKKRYCREGHYSELMNDQFRLFCAKHSTRGDCGLEDSDKNYSNIQIVGGK